MKIGVIGTGLIGGSMAIDARKKGLASTVLGFDPVNGEHALSLGIIDQNCDLEELCTTADLIILAIPVDQSTELLPIVLDLISDEQVVTDVGSTKRSITRVAKLHPNGSHFVPGHPIAGTEYSGPDAAMAGLFEGKMGILCPSDETSEMALGRVQYFYETLGMKVEWMSPEKHDMHLAYVSHLSHVSSFALGHTVLDIEKNEEQIVNLAGSGFESTVRLAKSSPAMWAPIFTENKESLLLALNEYIDQLNNFKQLLESNDREGLTHWMSRANAIGAVLDSKKKGITT